jgi:carbamoyl-phosphate synthase small subunit
LSDKVTTPTAYTLGENTGKRIAVLDFGVKQHILTSLTQRGGYLKVFPAQSTLAEILEFQPQAIFVSNGPGDPAAMPDAVQLVRELLALDLPMFGICLGHQLLALALGASTYKMHHGHRGINHPVINLKSMQSEITTQNHGFAVDKDSILQMDHVEITHVNLNDDSLEGIAIKNKPVFSVQYHPEATPGPHDSRYLFDQFLTSIK